MLSNNYPPTPTHKRQESIRILNENEPENLKLMNDKRRIILIHNEELPSSKNKKKNTIKHMSSKIVVESEFNVNMPKTIRTIIVMMK